jgi:hypothetical protein
VNAEKLLAVNIFVKLSNVQLLYVLRERGL